MKFHVGDTVIIECPKHSVFQEYNGCVCTVEYVERHKVGDYVKVDWADNGWWPVSYVRHCEHDEEIEAEDLFNIM